MTDKICIFHANCSDGFGAALAVVNHPDWGDDAEYIAAHYGDTPPDVFGKDVVIVDFSYPRETLLQMNRDASSLLVIDHHKTAQKDCEGLAFCIFDMEHSGAYLAWDHFHGEVPLFIRYIEDRDLWKWQLKGSKELSAALQTYEMDFYVWDEFLNDWVLDDLIDEGTHILKYQKIEVQRVIKRWKENPSFITLKNYKVPVLNTTTLVSEIGHELSKDYDFSATYFVNHLGQSIFSLRSQKDKTDVGEIARYYGGGGHPNAAGFTLDENDAILHPSSC